MYIIIVNKKCVRFIKRNFEERMVKLVSWIKLDQPKKKEKKGGIKLVENRREILGGEGKKRRPQTWIADREVANQKARIVHVSDGGRWQKKEQASWIINKPIPSTKISEQSLHFAKRKKSRWSIIRPNHNFGDSNFW